MNRSRLDIMIFALGLLFIGNSIAKSKTYNLEIQDKNPIDLCGKEFQKQVIIAPYMGGIIKSDNLIGFEMSLNYDPTIVKMNQKLFINTVSNLFEYKDIKFDEERREIVFDGSSSVNGNPVAVSADLPLFAVAGDFIGDCDDEAIFTVNYKYFPEFKGEVEIEEGLVIKGNIVDKPTREIGYKILEAERFIKKDSSLSVEVELKLGELTSLDYWKTEILMDTDSITIDSISGSNSIEIISVTKPDDNGYLVEFKVLNTENTKLFIDFTSHKVDSTIINIDLNTIETTECICATRFPSMAFSLTNKETKIIDTTSTTRIEVYSDNYEYINGTIIPTKKPVDIEVYNINGVLIEKIFCNINQVYSTKQDDLGIYFIKITSGNRTRIIKQINN